MKPGPYGFLARVLVCCSLGAAAMSAPSREYLLPSARSGWREENLGPQIHSLNVRGVVFGKGSTAYLVLMGQPGRLAVVDLKTRREIGGFSSSDLHRCVPSADQTPYLLSSFSGRLYHADAESTQPEVLAKPAEEGSLMYDLVPGRDGIYYGGVYPKGLVFRFDPRTREVKQLGPGMEGEDYARSLAFDAERNILYVGVGSHAALIEWNMTTGAKRNILPPTYRDQEFIDGIYLRRGRLIAHCLPSGTDIVLDARTGEVEGEIHGSSSPYSEPSPTDGAIYYTSNGNLFRYDLEKKERKEVAGPFNTSAVGYRWTTTEDGGLPILEVVMANG